MAAIYTWAPAPPEAGVLFYRVERSSDGGGFFEHAIDIPNVQNDDNFFDYSAQQFQFKDMDSQFGDVLRIASVSEVGIGPFSYIYPPTPLPEPPVPRMEIQGPPSPYKTFAPAMNGMARVRNASSTPRFGTFTTNGIVAGVAVSVAVVLGIVIGRMAVQR